MCTKLGSRDETIFREHRSLFRNPVNTPFSRRNTRRVHPYSPVTVRNRRSVWSHKFFCLSDINAKTVPTSRSARDALSAVDLGEKVLSVQTDVSAGALHEQLMQLFPALSACGGYTLLRCIGTSKSLQIIDPPPGGHTAVSLAGSVGQSRIYVRPLQRSIPLVRSTTSQEVSHSNNVCSYHLIDIALPHPVKKTLLSIVYAQ